jgi:branched-chain amino acid aminotransferase
VLEIAKHDGYEVREASVRPEELMEAAEVFLTGTTAGVLPVESIDGQPVGSEVPGPVSQALRDHFRRIVAGEDENFAHWLSYVDGNGEQ